MTSSGFRLLDLAEKNRSDIPLSTCAVVSIDAQEEYRSGLLALPNIQKAIEEGCKVLDAARQFRLPILHVAHRAANGAKSFAANSPMVEIFPEFQVRPQEPIIYKTLPDSFAGTSLQSELEHIGCKHLILFGFMTHMCVSTTARTATNYGYLSTIIANACGTRDLPGIDGTLVPAQNVHQIALTELADRFSFVVPAAADLFPH